VSARETRWDQEMRILATRARRTLRLVEAATAALPAIEDPDLATDLRSALGDYDLGGLRRDVERYDKDVADKAAEEAEKARGLAGFAELPNAPEATQCAAEVTIAMGRSTDFHRCDNVAKRIVFDREAGLERPVCTSHAKKFLAEGRTPWGWSKDLTHPSWLRAHGFTKE
jgi:hypothetical protein